MSLVGTIDACSLRDRCVSGSRSDRHACLSIRWSECHLFSSFVCFQNQSIIRWTAARSFVVALGKRNLPSEFLDTTTISSIVWKESFGGFAAHLHERHDVVGRGNTLTHRWCRFVGRELSSSKDSMSSKGATAATSRIWRSFVRRNEISTARQWRNVWIIPFFLGAIWGLLGIRRVQWVWRTHQHNSQCLSNHDESNATLREWPSRIIEDRRRSDFRWENSPTTNWI